MVGNQSDQQQNQAEWWTNVEIWWQAEAEAEAALEKEAEDTLLVITTEEVSKVDVDIIYSMDKVTEWTEAELAYLKLQAEEAFVIIRDRYLSEGLELDDAVRLALDETRDYMENIFDATRVALQDTLARILEEVDEEEDEEEEEEKGLVQTILDFLGFDLGSLLEGLAICFEWLGERLEDLLRIPADTIFEWLADIMPGDIGRG